jgi:hypothetical protein
MQLRAKERFDEQQKQILGARMYEEKRKKWFEAIVGRVDQVPKDPNYYEKLPVKPGFLFYQCLVDVSKTKLEMLRINIPEMLFVHYHGYMIYSEKGQIKIENAQDPATFLHLIRSNNMKKPESPGRKKNRSVSKDAKMSAVEKNRQRRVQQKTEKDENKKKENHKFDPEIYWNAPMGVYKKQTQHTCYQTSKLLNWKDTKQQVVNEGLNNKQLV